MLSVPCEQLTNYCTLLLAIRSLPWRMQILGVGLSWDFFYSTTKAPVKDIRIMKTSQKTVSLDRQAYE